MRVCANENVSADCVNRLRQSGHDVLWIREAAPGSSDPDVLARASGEERLLITFDKDFGELAFRRGAKASQVNRYVRERAIIGSSFAARRAGR